MKANLPWLAALLYAAAAAASADAQYIAPALHHPLPSAPDACGPGCYWTNPYGTAYGPNYYVQPAFPPVGGVPPPGLNPGGGGLQPPAIAVFPSHPYARGPRDYFMWTEAERERITRERRPALVP
jgi:hypothetical protein